VRRETNMIGAERLCDLLNRRATERGEKVAPCITPTPAELVAERREAIRSRVRFEIAYRHECAEAREDSSWLD
jgi:hypothetical protein